MNKITYDNVMDFVKNKSEFTNIDPEKIANNSEAIMKKVSIVGDFVKLITNIKNMISMIKASCMKQYKNVPKKTIVSICFALSYVFSPADLIPDNIPGIGYIDDISVVEYVIKSANKDIEDYVEWEKQQSSAA